MLVTRLLERFLPKLPSSLIVLVLGIVVSVALNLEDHGVTVVGKIPSSVDPAPDSRLHGYEVDANQEMIGMGASNAAVGFVRGFAASGSASRTAAVDGAGGTTQMVSIIASVIVLITAAFLTPLFTKLPECATTGAAAEPASSLRLRRCSACSAG